MKSGVKGLYDVFCVGDLNEKDGREFFKLEMAVQHDLSDEKWKQVYEVTRIIHWLRVLTLGFKEPQYITCTKHGRHA